MEAGDDVRLVLWTCKYRDCPIADRHNWLFGIVRREATPWTVDSTCWMVIQKFGLVFSSECTDRTELFEMLFTANERNRELV